MAIVVLSGVKRSPSIGLRWLGTTFHVVGTAATEKCRVAACAGAGARIANGPGDSNPILRAGGVLWSGA